MSLTDDLTGIPPTWRPDWAPDHDTPIYRDVLELLGIPGLDTPDSGGPVTVGTVIADRPTPRKPRKRVSS